ncbi:Lar family restriction alleviation protein [Paraburkholderia caledonica]|uniref:Restriction alleviation protein, Lar family n=1 Tax=Paraburkholderia caledonica TaxID=134536 RepID=A0AB73I7A4_9BURK|nr:hypothetical protein [Paraburkholderia caledonica]
MTTTMNTGAASLLPCPFCGGQAEMTFNAFYQNNSIATCKVCGASAFWKKWNARTPQADAAPSIGQHDISTSMGGRAYIAEFFAKLLRRHDFQRYIEQRLAADFACALAGYLSEHVAAIAAGGAKEPVPGTSEYGSWINKAKQATDCKLSFHRDEFKYLCQFEQELRKVYAAPLPREAATVPQIKPRLLNQLRRFNECCEDSEAAGHDVDKEDMHSLAELGAVRPAPGGRHYLTDFGHYLLAAASNGEKA